ncbi:hypothetical protein RPMA_03570 [Tardiphaga alba]|uniref:Uncharacterized protein n=1 Tax=Tardiphaga alba TaxID=340268 RepID=A0ABX8A383_9BRAD|nr:hypothetical protein [Tardiphaga alba]QUS38039.1 hypothetical protein RPMA_03570 [Tardiphaga alba]
MSSMKRTKGRGKEPSQALVDRPFVGQWSEEEAAIARQRLGVAIGPYISAVDGADPVSVRAALNGEPFGDLISDEAIAKLCREGRGADLFPPRYPTWRYGIDPVTYPCILVPPTIEELEAIADKQHLALLIRDLNIRGTTPRVRALIRSTVDPEWSWLGETVQDHLEAEADE